MSKQKINFATSWPQHPKSVIRIGIKKKKKKKKRIGIQIQTDLTAGGGTCIGQKIEEKILHALKYLLQFLSLNVTLASGSNKIY